MQPFQYYGGEHGQQQTQPLYQQQPQQQPQQQIDPSQMMGMMQNFQDGGGLDGITSMFGGGAGGTTGTMGMGSDAASLAAAQSGGGTAAGSGGASAGGGMSSGAAAAGPWAALAAIIAINEHNAIEGGYRSENKGEYAKDLFSGEVLGQDLEQRWLPKLGLEEGSTENKWASHLIHPVSADPQKSWESIKDLFS